MARQSELLEREAEEARTELASSLDELRQRLTPGEIVDGVIHYARNTPAADFARNVARDVQASPLPLLVIFAGIAWAALASALAHRRAVRLTAPTQTAPVEARPAELVSAVAQQEWKVALVNETVK